MIRRILNNILIFFKLKLQQEWFLELLKIRVDVLRECSNSESFQTTSHKVVLPKCSDAESSYMEAIRDLLRKKGILRKAVDTVAISLPLV